VENMARFDNGTVAVPRSAFLIEKVHRCSECPIRRLAAGRPHGAFARLHAWHKTWWPGWKAHQVRACEAAATAAAKF
jgi:hypothetical protein